MKLTGHSLRERGARHFCPHGNWHGWVIDFSPGGGQHQCCPDFRFERGQARCQCGSVSIPGQSIRANQRWHQAHKQFIIQRNQEI